MRRSIFYQPLAVFLAVILLPPFSWISGVGGASSIAVKAQISISGCAPDSHRIIQNLGGTCDPNWAPAEEVKAFEDAVIADWLKAHNMDPADGPLILQYGRSKLRSELRAYMLSRLLGLIANPNRDTHEQAFYVGLQKKVQQYEVAMYTAARDEYYKFNSDRCAWRPDSDLAKQYNLFFDPVPFCVPGQAPANYSPAYDYFVAYGMYKNSYGKAITDDPDGPRVQTDTGINLGLAVGAFALPAGAIGGALTGAVIFNYATKIFPYAFRAGSQFVKGNVAAAGAVLVFIAIVGGITASLYIFSNLQNDKNLANFNNDIATAQATLPNLSDMINTQIGKYKVTTAFTAQTLPEFISRAPLPQHRDTDPLFYIDSVGDPPGYSDTLRYMDRDGTIWLATAYDGWLSQIGATPGTLASDGTYTPGVTVDAFSPSMSFTGWDMKPYTASISGNNFMVTKSQPDSADILCPADAVTGVTANVLSTCAAWVAPSIQMMEYLESADGGIAIGSKKTVSIGRPPVFTSSNAVAWVAGAPSQTFQITATGIPSPTITLTGTLPAGVTFTSGNPAKLTGSTAASGVYPLKFTATGSRSVTQNFTFTVGSVPDITSPNSAVFTAGQPATFTITTTGSPTPIVVTGLSIPAGLTFKNVGDGTATISGTPDIPSHSFRTCTLPLGCNIVATNDLGSKSQPFTITVNPAALSVTSEPSGMPITLSNPPGTDGRSCPIPGSRTMPFTLNLYREDACVLTIDSTIAVNSTTRRVFQDWGFDASNPRTVGAPASAQTMTAFFQTQYFLTTSATNGGSISPGSTWVVPQFGPVGSIDLQASPSAGYAFTGFSGDLTGTTNPQNLTMNAPKTVTANFGLLTATALSAQSGAYNKPINLSAAVSAVNAALNSGVSGGLQFSVDGVNAGSAIPVNGAGTYSVPYTVTQGQGTYAVKAVFTGASAAIIGNAATSTLTVTPNSVTLSPAVSNPTSVQIVSTGTPASFQFTASFTLPAPLPSGAPLSALPVTATLEPLLGTTKVTCPVTTSLTSGVLTATASCSGVPVDVYSATLTLSGPYYSGSSTSVIPVYDPSIGNVNAGGALIVNGVDATIAVSAKYNKDGLPQGDVHYTAHIPGGDLTLKSTSLQSVSIVGNTAVILGKATIGNTGNYSFQATVAEAATGDSFGLQVTDPNGNPVSELSFSPIVLKGGDVHLPK